MKHLLSLFTILCLLSNSGVKAQETKKMNKTELKEHVLGLSTQIDSLKDVNFMLEESKDSLLLNVSLLASANDMNEIEISRLNNLVVINNQEIERLQSECDIEMANLNETILGYQSSFVSSQDSILNFQDSIVQLQADLLDCQVSFVNSQDSSVNNQETIVQLQNAILDYQNSIVQLQDSLSNSQSTTTPSNDFLNNYYKEQIPLPNNSFSLVLSKLVFQTKQNYNYTNALEILDVTELKFWGLLGMQEIESNYDKIWQIKDYVQSMKRHDVSATFPIIEVLKNKLFTLKFNNGNEESFLFNVTNTWPTSDNNQRRILRIELANEEVDNGKEDIVWEFFVIENECYLALNQSQLNRIDFNFRSGNEIEIFDQYENDGVQIMDWNGDGLSTGRGIYLSINQHYLDLDNVTFLFKLKEL